MKGLSYVCSIYTHCPFEPTVLTDQLSGHRAGTRRLLSGEVEIQESEATAFLKARHSCLLYAFREQANASIM